MMLTIMILYSLIKLKMLLSKSNPNVSTFTEEFMLTSDDKVNLVDKSLRFAWAIEGYNDKELKNDPRYVKIFTRLSGRKGGKNFETVLDHHLCTEEDMKDFPEPNIDSQRALNSIMTNEKRGLYCFDWDKIGE